ncbi:MAG: hypothetical protein WCC59_14500 [Terriglobales bacterium]
MRVSVGLDTQDKIQLAMDRTLCVREAMQSGIRPFPGIRDAYVFISGDCDLKFGADGLLDDRGRCGMMRVAAAAATVITSDFPNILLNSMTKKLLADYAELGMGGLDQVVIYTDTRDYKRQDRVRMGYLSDLSTVAEDDPYTDFAKPTDEVIQYTPTKRGNILAISRETILNDDLNKIQAFPTRAARAAHRTLKQFVTNFFVNNQVFGPDTLAWFHANHGNLGSAALTIDELIQREAALGLQTEKDSLKPLGLTLDWLMVPISLRAKAYQINNAQFYNPGPMIQVPNPFWLRFGDKGERIILNELLDASDVNDWYYGTLASKAPCVEVGFVQGRREPEIILQNVETVGAVFTNDRITYKIRHEYGGNVTDFRGVGKNIVA